MSQLVVVKTKPCETCSTGRLEDTAVFQWCASCVLSRGHVMSKTDTCPCGTRILSILTRSRTGNVYRCDQCASIPGKQKEPIVVTMTTEKRERAEDLRMWGTSSLRELARHHGIPDNQEREALATAIVDYEYQKLTLSAPIKVLDICDILVQLAFITKLHYVSVLHKQQGYSYLWECYHQLALFERTHLTAEECWALHDTGRKWKTVHEERIPYQQHKIGCPRCNCVRENHKDGTRYLYAEHEPCCITQYIEGRHTYLDKINSRIVNGAAFSQIDAKKIPVVGISAKKAQIVLEVDDMCEPP